MVNKKINHLFLNSQIIKLLRLKKTPLTFNEILAFVVKKNKLSEENKKLISGEFYLNLTLNRNFIFIIDKDVEKISLIDFYTADEKKKLKSKYQIHGIFRSGNDVENDDDDELEKNKDTVENEETKE